jgi:hypothetical protein
MPESEKDRIINDLAQKKRDFDKLLDELMAVKAARCQLIKMKMNNKNIVL